MSRITTSLALALIHLLIVGATAQASTKSATGKDIKSLYSGFHNAYLVYQGESLGSADFVSFVSSSNYNYYFRPAFDEAAAQDKALKVEAKCGQVYPVIYSLGVNNSLIIDCLVTSVAVVDEPNETHEDGEISTVTPQSSASGYDVRYISTQYYSLIYKKDSPTNEFLAYIDNTSGGTILSAISAGIALGKVIHVQANCDDQPSLFFQFGTQNVEVSCRVLSVTFD